MISITINAMEQVSIELMISGLLAALKQRHITETAKN